MSNKIRKLIFLLPEATTQGTLVWIEARIFGFPKHGLVIVKYNI